MFSITIVLYSDVVGIFQINPLLGDRGVFRSLQNIYNGMFFKKILMIKSC